MRRRFVFLLLIFLLLTSTNIASARGMLNGEECRVDQTTVIEGDLFVLCGELIIDGEVEGNVIGGARTARISGTVNGSIYLFGVELDVSGRLGKDIHWAGLVLDVRDTTDFRSLNSSVLSVNLSNQLHAGGLVPGNISNLGYQLILDGDVGGELNFWGSALKIGGTIGQDVNATVGDSESSGASSQIETLLIPFQVDVELIDPGLRLDAGGQVNGQLEYTGPSPGTLEGTTEFPPIFNSTQEPILAGTTVEQSAASIGRYLSVVLREFTGLAFIGVLCVLLIPRYIQSPVDTLQVHPVSTLGVGMLSFILSFPIVLIVALLSVLLIVVLAALPLENVVLFTGVVLGLANIGGASVFYFTAIYIARVVVALALGRFIMRVLLQDRYDRGTWQYLALSMLTGVFLLSLAGSIPIIGWGFNALALFLGLGAILVVLRRQLKSIRTPSPQPAFQPPPQYEPDFVPRLPYLAEEAEDYPPPLIEDEPPPAGMGDLPEGFNWWQSDQGDDR
jgi:hypothetical protein